MEAIWLQCGSREMIYLRKFLLNRNRSLAPSRWVFFHQILTHFKTFLYTHLSSNVHTVEPLLSGQITKSSAKIIANEIL